LINIRKSVIVICVIVICVIVSAVFLNLYEDNTILLNNSQQNTIQPTLVPTPTSILIPTPIPTSIKTSRSGMDRDQYIREKIIQSFTKNLKGKFKGKAEYIYDTGKKYEFSNNMIIRFASIMMHETGNGTSDYCVNRNNPGGLYDGKLGVFKRFNTIEKGIDATAEFIKNVCIDKGKVSLEEMKTIYAPDDAENDPTGLNKEWIPGIRDICKMIIKDTGLKVDDLS
jgi:hypothetical protein